MRALIVNGSGVEGLEIKEIAEAATPGHGQVLVAPKAFSLNFRDLLIAENRYGAPLKEPQIAGSDLAGEVVAVGPGVTNLKAGDRVLNAPITGWLAGEFKHADGATFLGGGGVPGVFAERVVLPAAALVKYNSLSFAEAATIPIAGLTAWSAVVTHGKLLPGGTVLCLGTGGVSVFAAQIASAMGATVIVTSSSDEKLARVKQIVGREIGAINYRTTPDWQKEVVRLTNRRGVDVVVETVGGDSLQKSLESVAYHGRICQVGLLAGIESTVSIPHLLTRQAQLIGIYMESVAELQRFLAFVATVGLKPVIDSTFPFAKIKDAYNHMKVQGHLGKIVVEMG